jgi:pimeloyl-ACP methyl ester carboxylesterase
MGATMHFKLPVPSTSFDIELDDGAKIRIRRHGFGGGIRLLLSPGNGFAADAYFPYWQHLLEKFDLLIFDFRNHGQNGLTSMMARSAPYPKRLLLWPRWSLGKPFRIKI